MMPTTRDASTRNGGIDALRGIAIVLVVLNHVGIRIPLAKSQLADWLPAPLLKDLNYNGYEAVFVFFVISGFLITQRSLERWGALRALDVRDFYLRRAARILPCLFAVLAVLAALRLLRVPQFTITRPAQSLPGALASAAGLYLNWYEGATGYLPGNWDVLWSLSIEEAFYLGFPLLCASCGGTRVFVAVLVLLAAAMPWTHAAAAGNEIWQEKAYLPGMGAIAVGILAALYVRRVPRASGRADALLRIAGAIGLVAILFAGRTVWQLLRDGYLLVLTGAATCLVVGMHRAAAAPESRPLAALGWLRSCGRLSYEIYLTHMFVVFGVVAAFRALELDAAWGWVAYPPALALSWLLGRVVARGFSQPAERSLRARFGRTRSAAPALAAPADV